MATRVQIFTSLNTATLVINDTTNIVNSAGWVVSLANTSGWVFAQSNTSSIVQVSSGSMYIVNTGGERYMDSTYTFDAGTRVVPKFAKIDASATNNAVVLPVTNKRIRVLSAYLISSGTNNAIWQSDSSSATNLTGVSFLASNVGYVLPYHPHGWFQTGTSTLLNLNLSVANSIGGCITYIETS